VANCRHIISLPPNWRERRKPCGRQIPTDDERVRLHLLAEQPHGLARVQAAVLPEDWRVTGEVRSGIGVKALRYTAPTSGPGQLAALPLNHECPQRISGTKTSRCALWAHRLAVKRETPSG